MKRKLIAFLVLAVLVLSTFPVLASFPDMESSSWDWSRSAIDKMTSLGIIKGYSDGTFRPGNSITKGEAMVLLSRAAGYTTDGNKKYVEQSTAYYSKLVSSLSTPYRGEISYLIYRGILTESDYLTYAADNVVNAPLKRYEAAELLAKLASNNAKLSGSVTQLTFSDIASITTAMAPYIKYVVDSGIMLGMGNGTFSPNETVTRAQITVMLSRIIPFLSYSYYDGTIKSYDSTTGTLNFVLTDGTAEAIEVPEDVIVRIDGAPASIDTILADSTARITVSNENVVIIETISPDYDTVVNGKYRKIEAIDKNTNAISITDPTTGDVLTYALDKSVTVQKNDSKITVTDLTKDDYVVLSIKSGVVISIVADSKTQTTEGKVTAISFTPTFKMTILTSGQSVSYEFSENVTVTRNKKSSTLENILVGDNVSITTTYGVISAIDATSKTSSIEGSITSLTISNTPSITVTDKSNKSYTYAIVKTPSITTQSGVEKDFYDLRVGDKVSLDIDASTVTSIKIVSSFAGGNGEGSSVNINGIVEYVNTTYGYIKLVDSSELIFVSKATISDSTGKTIALKSISAGDSITAFGVASNGSYTATMVVAHK